MNTLLPTALNQSGIPAGLAAVPRLPDPNPTPSNSGFLSLIHALLSLMEPMPPAAPNASSLDISNAGLSNASGIVPQGVAPLSAPSGPVAPTTIRSTPGDGQPQPAQPGEAKDPAEERERRLLNHAGAGASAPVAWVFQPVAARQPPGLDPNFDKNQSASASQAAKTALSAFPIVLDPASAPLIQTVIFQAIPLEDGPLGSPQPARFLPASPHLVPASAVPSVDAKSPVPLARRIFLSPTAPAAVLVQAELAPAAAPAARDQIRVASEAPCRRLSPCSRLMPFSVSTSALAPTSAPARAEPISTLRPTGLEHTEVLLLSEDDRVEPRRLAVPGAELAFSAHLTPLVTGTPAAHRDDPPQAEPRRASEPAREIPGNVKTTFPTREDREDPAPRVAAASASSGTLPEHAGDFARTLETQVPPPAAPARGIGPTLETPFHATAEAIRTAEPVSLAAAPHGVAPAHEISVRIDQPDTPAIDLHVVQRSGQVQVAVRTPDATLQTSLRQDLSTLVNSLEHAGYRTETFAPREATVNKTSSSEMNSQPDRQDSRPDFSGRGSGDSSHGRQHHRQRDPRPPAWLADSEQPA